MLCFLHNSPECQDPNYNHKIEWRTIMENPIEEDTFLTKGAAVTMQDDLMEWCLWELDLVGNEHSFGAPSIFEADGALSLECA